MTYQRDHEATTSQLCWRLFKLWLQRTRSRLRKQQSNEHKQQQKSEDTKAAKS